jgi:hypothetical protein
MDIDIAKQLGQEVADDINFETSARILKEFGWFTVNTVPLTSSKDIHDLRTWLDYYSTGRVKARKGVFLFEKEKDAVMFSLRWGA